MSNIDLLLFVLSFSSLFLYLFLLRFHIYVNTDNYRFCPNVFKKYASNTIFFTRISYALAMVRIEIAWLIYYFTRHFLLNYGEIFFIYLKISSHMDMFRYYHHESFRENIQMILLLRDVQEKFDKLPIVIVTFSRKRSRYYFCNPPCVLRRYRFSTYITTISCAVYDINNSTLFTRSSIFAE